MHPLDMTDKELADAFFNRLKERGFEAKFDTSGYDTGNPNTGSWELHGLDGMFCEIDFIDGEFFRISGFTHGHWQDEVDLRKYR